MTKTRSRRRVVVVDNSALARAIGSRIRRKRQERGLSQRALAKDRFTPSYISALETGAVKPSMAALAFLAERLECSINDLLGDQPRPNARTGLRLEADLRLASGQWGEASDLFAELLESSRGDDERAELLRGLSEALVRQRKGPEAIGAASEAVSLFDRLQRSADAAEARYWLAAAHYQAENSDEAQVIYRALLAHAHAGEPPTTDFRARVLIAAANAEIWTGDRERAATYLEEARSLADAMGDKQRAAFLLSLALSYRDTGDLEAAVRAGQRSLALYESLDARREQVTLENGLALAHLGLGSLDKAEAHAAKASQLTVALGAEDLSTHVTDTLAQIALARRDWPRAVELADEALAKARQQANRHAEVDGLLTRAHAHAGAKNADPAIADFEAATRVARDIRSKRQLRSALSSLAEFLADQGRHADAVEAYREVIGID